MYEHGEHHHCHGHGGEGHWGERPEHPHHRHGGECGWGREGTARRPGSPFRRHFITREEQIAWLEEYLKQLQAEAKGVEERIAEMKASA